MSTRPLFTPYRMGDLDLPNRIVMAPLTRMRARPDDHVPTVWQAEYYAQRATAGLIVTEGVAISPEGFGWADTPGLWSEEQVRGWSHVTDAVHAAGGRIVVQLWHTGAMSHPDLRGGALPLSASDVNPEQQSVTVAGRVLAQSRSNAVCPRRAPAAAASTVAVASATSRASTRSDRQRRRTSRRSQVTVMRTDAPQLPEHCRSQ